VQGDYKDMWLYLIAPVVGGVLASLVQNYIFIPRSQSKAKVEPSELH
jgi:hypothetical protein